MKTKFPLREIEPLALKIKSMLQPMCEKIEIAGSIRRRKSEASDIELVYIPKIENRPDGLFDTKPFSLADEQIEQWLASGKISKRPSIRGTFTWGPKNKLALHQSGIPIDFFSTTLENWWVSLVVRTGSKEFNLALTAGAQKRGGSLEAYGAGVRYQDGSLEVARSEEEVCKLCGVAYLPPEKR